MCNGMARWQHSAMRGMRMQVPSSPDDAEADAQGSSTLISTSAVQPHPSGRAARGQEDVNVSGEFARLGSGASSGTLQGLLSSEDAVVKAHSSISGGAVHWHRSLTDVRRPLTHRLST